MEDLFYYQDLYEPIEGDMTNPKEKSKKRMEKDKQENYQVYLS